MALDWLVEFVNTSDLEEDRDEIGTPARLRDWLVAAEALRPGERVSTEAHARALDIREGLRALGRGNNGEPLEVGDVARLNAAAAGLPLVATLAGEERWRLAPTADGVDGFLSQVMATTVGAMADGSWSRVKACRNDTCRWLFIDHSRNRSATWCSMAVCGSRLKARAYRARRRGSVRVANAH
jgi:predicted RNA-binding Zn ribbon-like protein